LITYLFFAGFNKPDTFEMKPLCGLLGLVLKRITGSETSYFYRFLSNGDYEFDFVKASIVLGLPASTFSD